MGRRDGDGQPGREDSRKAVAGGPARWQLADRAVPHSRTDKPGGTNGERDRLCNPGFQHGEIKPKSL